MDEHLERRQVQLQTRWLWYTGWADVAIGVAALLWGDALLPSTMPTTLGLSMGTIIGLTFLLVAAPAIFALYYFRRRQEAKIPPASRNPVEKL